MEGALTPAQVRFREVIAAEVAAIRKMPAARAWKNLVATGAAELAVPESEGGLGLGLLEISILLEELGPTGELADVARDALVAGDPLWAQGCEDVDQLARLRRSALPVCAMAITGLRHRPRKVGARVVGERRGEDRWEVSWVGEGGASRLATFRAREATMVRVRDRGWVGHASALIGIARRAQHLAVERASSRRLGEGWLINKQAVAHRLARCSCRIITARAVVRRAVDEDISPLHDSDARMSSYAAAAVGAAAEAALAVTRDMAQVFGAAATTDPEVAHLYQLARDVAVAGGPVSKWWREAATGMGGRNR